MKIGKQQNSCRMQIVLSNLLFRCYIVSLDSLSCRPPQVCLNLRDWLRGEAKRKHSSHPWSEPESRPLKASTLNLFCDSITPTLDVSSYRYLNSQMEMTVVLTLYTISRGSSVTQRRYWMFLKWYFCPLLSTVIEQFRSLTLEGHAQWNEILRDLERGSSPSLSICIAQFGRDANLLIQNTDIWARHLPREYWEYDDWYRVRPLTRNGSAQCNRHLP